MTSADPLLDANGIADGAALLKHLAHPGRLAIVARLRRGETTVAAMERELELRQPSLSQQLAELREAGIVEARRKAKTVHYRLVDGKAARIVDLLAELLDAAGADLPVPAAPRRNTGRTTGRRLSGAAMFAVVAERHGADDVREG